MELRRSERGQRRIGTAVASAFGMSSVLRSACIRFGRPRCSTSATSQQRARTTNFERGAFIMAVRRNRFEPLHQLREELDRQFPVLWDTLSGRLPQLAARSFPGVEHLGGTRQFVRRGRSPGFKNEDLDISVVGNELTIKGNRQEAAVRQGDGLPSSRTWRAEHSRAWSVCRSKSTRAQVEANLRDGVLLVTLPKSEAAKPHKDPCPNVEWLNLPADSARLGLNAVPSRIAGRDDGKGRTMPRHCFRRPRRMKTSTHSRREESWLLKALFSNHDRRETASSRLGWV